MFPLELSYAALGTGFTCFVTVLGSATVFFFKKDISDTTQRIFLGFAAGIMIAASVWSLLLPAIEMAGGGAAALLPVTGGFAIGGLFLLLLNRLLPQLYTGFGVAQQLPSKLRRTAMIVLSITLHNIPEGMAVGLAFAIAVQGNDPGALAGAAALALGIGLQNFPEGAAISLPLKAQGASNKKAFVSGAFSGVVEPIFGILTVLIASSVAGVMPWILAFAAGAMIYVVVEELIPEAHLGEHSHSGTLSVMVGFLIMMMLDVALG